MAGQRLPRPVGIAANGEPGFVLGVVGGSGGAGSSTFAAVLARTAPSAMLIDLDLVGGGLDVLLGIEATPGARWSGVQLDGGRLDPELLERGLPRWCGVPVLAVDSGVLPPIGAVLAAARERGTVVLDLPRQPDPVRENRSRPATWWSSWLVLRCGRCRLRGRFWPGWMRRPG